MKNKKVKIIWNSPTPRREGTLANLSDQGAPYEELAIDEMDLRLALFIRYGTLAYNRLYGISYLLDVLLPLDRIERSSSFVLGSAIHRELLFYAL
jgi:hypothetical protein